MKYCFFISVLFAVSIRASAQKNDEYFSPIQKTFNDTTKYFSLRVLPSDYYSSNAGFFCKKELKIQNTLKVPLRLRLGSVSYCDAMEGKNNLHP